MKKISCFVTQIDLALAPELKRDLSFLGFTLSHPPHTLFCAKQRGVTCTLYTSGKLTVQGKDKESFISSQPQLFKGRPEIHPHIGVDEAGKGDLFGPLCICALFVGSGDGELLTYVRDSKKMADSTVLDIAKKLKQSSPHEVVAIFPEKYNALYEHFHNLNSLLAWGHATAIHNLVQQIDCKEVIVDQFAKEGVLKAALRRKGIEVDLTQRHKGEEDLAVAAASIIARATFLEGIEKLEKTYRHPLPKGASQVTIAAGRELCQMHGKGVLGQVAKLHFTTAQKVLGD